MICVLVFSLIFDRTFLFIVKMAPETVPVEDIKEHLTLVKFIVTLFHVCIMYNIINLSFPFSIFVHILCKNLEAFPQFRFFFALFI